MGFFSPRHPKGFWTRTAPLGAPFVVIIGFIVTFAFAPGVAFAQGVPLAAAAMPDGFADEGQPLDLELERQVRQVSLQLRCIVCTGQSVWDSNSAWAFNRREEVRALLRAGMDEGAVIEEFKSRWGPGILMYPPREGAYWITWVLPPALLLVGGAFVAAWIRRYRRTSAGPPARGAASEAEGDTLAGAVPEGGPEAAPRIVAGVEPGGAGEGGQGTAEPEEPPTPEERAELERRIRIIRGLD